MFVLRFAFIILHGSGHSFSFVYYTKRNQWGRPDNAASIFRLIMQLVFC